MTTISRALVLLSLCLFVVSGCASAQPNVEASGIGELPTFLPTPSAKGVAHGSADSPAMSYPGSPVVVQLATGHVTVDVQGPALPPGTALGAVEVVCTFTVTLRDADTTVPLAASQFDVLDHLGGVHPVTPAPSTTVPALVVPAQAVTFQLAATLPSGEGLIRYHPTAGAVVAAWDYVAETD